MPRLSRRFQTGFVSLVMFGAFCLGPACVVRADEVDTKNDARLDCYPSDKNAPLKDAGTATTWLAFAALGMLGLGGLFLNAKRSHLD